MLQMLECVVVLGLYFILFWIFGGVTEKLFKLKSDGTITRTLIGFFSYYAVFQMAALPLIIKKKSLTLLTILWIVVCVLIAGIYIAISKDKKAKIQWKKPTVGQIMLLCLVLFACFFIAIQYVMGWDTVYYVGNINASLYTDTMYQYNGTTGLKVGQLFLRYALSAFYMHSAVICKIFRIPPLMLQKYVVAVWCMFLYVMLLVKLGEVIFKESRQKRIAFVVVAMLLNFFFQSDYTTSQFLLLRSMEAKGYCANVVLPAVFLLGMLIVKNHSNRDYWKMLFIVAFASVPISMSAIMIVPVMIAIITLTDMIMYKSWKNIWKGIVCVIPNGIYLIVYYLFTIQMIRIRV